MPGVALWIDDLRRVFGRDEIDDQIRKGLRGESVFYAKENGHVIGRPSPPGVQLSAPFIHPDDLKHNGRNRNEK